VQNGNVDSITVNNTGGIGTLNSGKTFHTTGQMPPPDADLVAEPEERRCRVSGRRRQLLAASSRCCCPCSLIIGFFVWMRRQRRWARDADRASRAKTYSAESRHDVRRRRGYRREAGDREVVDFLKMPERFRDIGARIPKGVLLVGPRVPARR
jgi:cell division protease FtsH